MGEIFAKNAIDFYKANIYEYPFYQIRIGYRNGAAGLHR
jgi:hypothetical protein